MKKLMFIIICLVMIFQIVSAFNFDNVKKYDPNKNEVTITNGFGLGSDLAKMKLNTPQKNVVPLGYQKVAEFEYNVLEDTDNHFSNMEFYDIEKGMQKINRDFDYKYKINQEVEVIDYKEICSTQKNGTRVCDSTASGSHIEIKEVWIPLNKDSFKKGEVYTIGIFTNVELGDHIEWIPTYYGQRIDEWAAWTGDLKLGLVAHWTCDEVDDSTTKLVDAYNGVYNFTGNAGTITTGKIGNTCTFVAASTDYYNQSDNSIFDVTAGDDEKSMCAWVKMNSTSAQGGFIYKQLDGGDGYTFYTDDTGIVSFFNTDGADVAETAHSDDNDWHFHCAVLHSGNVTIYYDGVYNNSAAAVMASSDTNADLALGCRCQAAGCAGRDFYFTGYLDEISFWNRSISDAEIGVLYDGGNGRTFNFSNSAPTVTLNKPVDANKTLSLDTIFNCTAKDDMNVSNFSLIIDDSPVYSNDSGVNNFTEIYRTETLTVGNHTWTCNATDNESESTQPAIRSIQSGYIVEYQNYTENTTEGATETFAINFSKAASLTVSTVTLVYNNTKYSSPYTVSGNSVFSERTASSPTLVDSTNISFKWNVTFTNNQGFETSLLNHSVSNVSVDDCSSFSNLMYNFTNYDEQTKEQIINSTIDIHLRMYSLDQSLLIINFSQQYEDAPSAEICLENQLSDTVNYTTYITTKYTANDTDNNRSYSDEYYNVLNKTTSNSTLPLNISLYDLRTADRTNFRLTFRDSSYSLAPNILVQVYRQYVSDGDFKIVEIPLTDSNGQTILNLVKNNVVYNFVMVNEAGETVATFNSITAFCQDFTIGECTINLNADPEGSTVYDYNSEFDISITEPSYDNSTEEVSITFITDDLLPKTIRMEVFRNNDFGNRSVCTNEVTSSSGTLTCDVSAVTDSDQFLFVYVYVDGDLAKQYTINLNADTLNFGVTNGAFLAFLIILTLICIFMEDKQILVVSLGIGWVAILGFGLIKGSLFGATSAGVWFVVSIIIFLWKLEKEDRL